MTTDRAAQPPPRKDPAPAVFLELFFDLVYVFALLQVAHRLLEDLTSERRIVLGEGTQTLLVLAALWLVWTYSAWTTSTFDPQRPLVQAIIVATMLGSLAMAVAVPDALGGRALLFAGAYVAIQLGRPLIFVLVLRGQENRDFARRILFWFGVSSVPWITGALQPEESTRTALWAGAIAIDYTVARLGWPTPRLGRTSTVEWTISGEHLGERYRQLFLIALGELILETGIEFSGEAYDADRAATFLVSFLTTVLLWRIYFFRAGELLATAIAAAPDPARLARSAAYAHFFMLAGTVATAVGYRLVIAHPFGPTDPAWIGVILGGPALFLLGRGGFEYAVFARVSRSRLIGALVLAILSPAMILLPPLMVAVTASLVLLGIAVTDAARARHRPPEWPSPPR